MYYTKYMEKFRITIRIISSKHLTSPIHVTGVTQLLWTANFQKLYTHTSTWFASEQSRDYDLVTQLWSVDHHGRNHKLFLRSDNSLAHTKTSETRV
jgi:hypothetical protein